LFDGTKEKTNILNQFNENALQGGWMGMIR
jgi:hypothetical protein